MRRGRYYLGRVAKTGQLNQKSLISSITEPRTVRVGEALWTFTDTLDRSDAVKPYVFGRLSKYSREGHLTVVDTNTHLQREEIAENLLIAASPFIYLPDFSGIAYLHVWNGVQEEVFRRRFERLVEEAFDHFFVSCEIEPVADYRTFVTKLQRLERITEIRARVRPPNPLFGDLWRDLKEYINERRASEVLVAENSNDKSGLATKVISLINSMLSENSQNQNESAAVTDAALLMAADGYGTGKVVGIIDEEQVSVRTSDTQKSFLFAKEPEIVELALEVLRRFEKISAERDMKH